MSDARPQQHPAPHRGRARSWTLLLALAAGPAAWATQLLIGYGLSSYACYPGDAPRTQSPPPGWQGETLWLLTLNLLCLGLTVAGFLVAWGAWRRTRDEKGGGARHLLDVGEGRTRFLAIAGMLACAMFAAAIAFNTVNLLSVPACWEVAR